MKTAVDLLNENEVLREKLKYYIREHDRLNEQLDYYIKYNNMLLDKLTEVTQVNAPSILYVEKNNGVISID